MNYLQKLFEMSMRHVFEPGLNWVLDHPVISVAVVVVLIYWSVRGYRML
ncbi:MAG TPA: hypothetical protein VMR20_05990 [Verrucomicrobiae bacterium]|jgi:hypothetical protein|nr:hypothetical protein [Verrucomicrobiae bacterium]